MLISEPLISTYWNFRYKIAGERELEHRERLGITDAPSVMTSLPMSKAR